MCIKWRTSWFKRELILTATLLKVFQCKKTFKSRRLTLRCSLVLVWFLWNTSLSWYRKQFPEHLQDCITDWIILLQLKQIYFTDLNFVQHNNILFDHKNRLFPLHMLIKNCPSLIIRPLICRYPSRYGLYLRDKPSQVVLPQELEYEPDTKPHYSLH